MTSNTENPNSSLRDSPIASTLAHIDPEFLDVVLEELDWTPKADAQFLIDLVRDEKEKANIRLAARHSLRELILENLERSGTVQLLTERIKARLPGGLSAEASRSSYLQAGEPSKTQQFLERLSNPDVEKEPSNASRSQPDKPGSGDERIIEVCVHPPSGGPGPLQAGQRPPAPPPGGPCDGRADHPEPCRGGDPNGGPGNDPGRHAANEPGEGSAQPIPERPPPCDGRSSSPGQSEAPRPNGDGDVGTDGNPFQRKPERTVPAFGRPIGRKPPTKSTIGGGICGEPNA